ncbi:L-type lectin-domain containing receptor kinase IX.1-like [Arachis stenosperma]|uniref:L-type lectin-domain containing receptor kinase IX.1-like n=1 Tax=Arachis stenosperma TaxID=217475 RepID=UPI0025ACEADE|nr:L-type lectin-domain containing receptor kinase IX.1-like [Arachis stenosperma]
MLTSSEEGLTVKERSLTNGIREVHSLHFNINSFNEKDNMVSYEGDAIPFEGSIELNKNDINRVGHAVYNEPLHLWDSSTKALTDFSTAFSFTISQPTNKTADGFAFYMAPLGYQIPPNSYGGALGLFNSTTQYGVVQNHVFMVEFDTFRNPEYDPNDWNDHVGINSNSLKSLTYAWYDFDNNIGKKTHALITYNSSTNILNVSWFFNATSTNTLSYEIDLRGILPEYVTVGFSAATGPLKFERNVIHSWNFMSTLESMDSEVNKNKKKKKKQKMVIVAVASSILLVLVIGSVYWLTIIIKKRRTKHVRDDDLGGTLVTSDLGKASIPRRFDYRELAAATDGFSKDKRLGRGGSGEVYKGFLKDLGRFVAVKKIFADFQNSEKIFINEVKIISRLIHRNLVQFIGWCHEQQEFLLVFEYMPNGSLDTHLFGSRRTLAWDVRYKMALGIATALHYLHEDAEQCVLHRDIKSANVLLDTDFSTKLGDFGMAKLVDPTLKTQRTGVVGTYGYLAPEYLNGGRASKESDIYSFAIVALEIACGRKTYQDGEYHIPLVKWVWQLHVEGNILNVADEGLNKNFDELQMTCLLIVGLWCTNPNDKERPKAAQVIKVLQLESPLPALPHDIHDHHLRPTMENFRNSSQSSPFTNSLVNDGR